MYISYLLNNIYQKHKYIIKYNNYIKNIINFADAIINKRFNHFIKVKICVEL